MNTQGHQVLCWPSGSRAAGPAPRSSSAAAQGVAGAGPGVAAEEGPGVPGSAPGRAGVKGVKGTPARARLASGLAKPVAGGGGAMSRHIAGGAYTEL